MSCPVLEEVIQKDGAFKQAYWSICTSKSCDNEHAKWAWVAGMNGERTTKVGREGINMSTDGTLQIQKVRFMCRVKGINHESPLVHFATLNINKDGELKLWNLRIARARWGKS